MRRGTCALPPAASRPAKGRAGKRAALGKAQRPCKEQGIGRTGRPARSNLCVCVRVRARVCVVQVGQRLAVETVQATGCT